MGEKILGFIPSGPGFLSGFIANMTQTDSMTSLMIAGGFYIITKN